MIPHRPTAERPHLWFYGLLVFALIIQAGLWFYARGDQARWANVPPVPSHTGAVGFGLGDPQFAYRSIGIMMQNLGNNGGRTIKFDDYDYDGLAGWFNLSNELDPVSDFMPFLAGYYFGAVDDPAKAVRVVDYLAEQGMRPEPQKWRWLARAAFLARFAEKDTDKALKLSQQLAALYPSVPLPFWARQMPVFILQERGEKEAALAMILETLRSDARTLPPQEINTLVDYMCHRLLSHDEASKYELCVNFKERD
ncbi:MAG: hypothetical protein LRY62_03765 [Alphaproteobacteria bacterium]|nr:hypothetical protein [Alphaproteobacteria bacterium]